MTRIHANEYAPNKRKTPTYPIARTPRLLRSGGTPPLHAKTTTQQKKGRHSRRMTEEDDDTRVPALDKESARKYLQNALQSKSLKNEEVTEPEPQPVEGKQGLWRPRRQGHR